MNKITSIVLTVFLLTACGGENDHQQHIDSATQESSGDSGTDRTESTPGNPDVPYEVSSAFDGVLDLYLQLTSNLVEGNPEEIAANGQQLHDATREFREMEMDEELSVQLDPIGSELLAQSEKISEENDIEAQRKAFDGLSSAMISLVEIIGHQKETLYHQRCPMVNGGNGDWLSTEELILNPYYGNRMLHCGSIIRIL